MGISAIQEELDRKRLAQEKLARKRLAQDTIRENEHRKFMARIKAKEKMRRIAKQ